MAASNRKKAVILGICQMRMRILDCGMIDLHQHPVKRVYWIIQEMSHIVGHIFQGSEGTTPCEVTPFEQGRCVIDLPYVVQQASGDKVHFVAGLNKIEAEQLARLNGVWLLDQTDPNAVI